MKILSYNVYGVKDTVYPIPSWEVRQENLYKNINQILEDKDIKVLCFQEVNENNIELLEKIIKENDEVGRSEIISPDIAPEESMLQKIEDEIFAPKNKCTIIKRVNGVVVDVIKPGEERPVENIDERLISVEGTREAVEIDAETLDELIEQLTVDKK